MSINNDFFNASWSDIKNSWDRIYLSALNEDWDRTIYFAQQRHEKLLAHFENFPICPDNSKQYKSILEEMVKSEKSIQQIINKTKANLSNEVKMIRNQKLGIGMYQASGI